MEHRDLGATGIKVSSLGFGGAEIWHDISEDAAKGTTDDNAAKLLNAVLDAGVNLIDTAKMYGRSQERIGRAIAHRRDEFILSSKCGFDADMNGGWSADAIARDIDESLRLLRTDRIDIMHLHTCDLDILENGEAIAALERAVEQGKVRVAAYSGDDRELVWAVESGRFGSVQCSINVCDQQAIDTALPKCRERGLPARNPVGVIVKRPIANAFWRFDRRPTGEYGETYWERAQKMGLKPDPFEWDELALRFAAWQEGVSSCIVGTRNLDHFLRNLDLVSRGPLPEAKVNEIRELFRQHDEGWVGQG